MDPTVRLRIATRIHFALLRHYGEDVAVATLLRGGAAAREALWVCEASADAELVALGRQFGSMLGADAAARRAAHRAEDRSPPQDASWANNTSGFGITRPGDDAADAAKNATARPGAWRGAARWWKRSTTRAIR